jgi:uncharacterized FlgJ-related protein
MYRFNSITLTYEKLTIKFYFKLLAILLFVTVGLSYTSVRVIETEKIPVVIVSESSEDLTKDKLLEYLKQCNVKFPNIVLKQALLESNGFKSNIYKQNNNLFGMRISTSRPTTHKGSHLGFAAYNSWKESVLDYALWQASYTRTITTESQYYAFLDEIYCTDVVNQQKYSETLKKL